jgi:hypothetical protein
MMIFYKVRLRYLLFSNNGSKVKVKLSFCFSLTEYQAMKAYWGVEV